ENGIRIVSGGTDNHLLLLDVSKLGLTGKVAEEALDAIGITANKNTIPFDQEGPFITSGVRVGSAAVTSRGFKEEDMQEVGAIIAEVLHNLDDKTKLAEAEKRMTALTDRFPLYALKIRNHISWTIRIGLWDDFFYCTVFTNYR